MLDVLKGNGGGQCQPDGYTQIIERAKHEFTGLETHKGKWSTHNHIIRFEV